MASNTGRLGKASWIKEVAWGTYLTPTRPLSLTQESIENKVEHVEDGRFIGKIFTTDMIAVSEQVDGSVDVTAHPQEVGPLVDMALGKNDAPGTAPSGRLLVWYTGADAYAHVINTLGVMAGFAGATVGTAVSKWSFDTANASYDTLAELATAINAVADWNAYYTGVSTALTAGIGNFTALIIKTNGQLSGMVKNIASISATTKEHHIYPAGATDTEPSMSICVDRTIGTGQALGFAGAKVNSFAIAIASKTIVKMTVGLNAKSETSGKTYPTIIIPSDKPYVASRARVFVNGTEATEIKDLNITLNNNLDISNVVGSVYVSEQIRQGATLQVSGSMNFNATDWTSNYALYKADTPIEMYVYIENADYADAVNEVKYSILIKLAAVKLTKSPTPLLSGPNRLTSSIEGTCVEKSGVNHVDFYVVDTETTAY